MRTVNTNQHARRQLHVTLMWQSRMLKKLLAVYRLVLPSSAKWWENKERQKHTARQSRRKNREPKKAARTNKNPRKRRRSQPPQSAENKIFHAESAIKSLKRHTDKGTCPESLQYRARARIWADNEFKMDIKRIRKNAEQKFIRALTRFHCREINRTRV